MKPYQKAFIEFILKHQILRFGEFVLKSGRVSPYFFNSGSFSSGYLLTSISRFYAEALIDSGVHYDMLFGAAYKGIPLVSAVSMALCHQDFNYQQVPFAFDRKEIKTHGEGGILVGAPLSGSIVLIDDVITAGTAIRQVIKLINEQVSPGTFCLSALLVALDRQECYSGSVPAIQALQQDFSMPVISIVTLADVFFHISKDTTWSKYAKAVEQYRYQYGQPFSH